MVQLICLKDVQSPCLIMVWLNLTYFSLFLLRVSLSNLHFEDVPVLKNFCTFNLYNLPSDLSSKMFVKYVNFYLTNVFHITLSISRQYN